MNATSQTIEVVVTAVQEQAQGICSWEFRRPDGGELPPFTAGAHVDLHLANGLNRSYSLCNSQADRDRYVVGIANDPNSRGGSKFIHESLKIGDRIQISAPRNNFPLVENAPLTVFIAGGIGITPMYCMIQRLETLGRPWQLYYSTRVRALCAFKPALEALEAKQPGRVHFNFDQEPGGKITDLKALIASKPAGTHFYCCGPTPMLKAYESSAKELGRPEPEIHVEYFSAKEEASTAGGYTVVLQRTGKSFEVAPGKTMLDVLLANNIDVAYSCLEGVCGTCETRVLEGVPDHRDAVLSPEERASNKTIMVCCSGSKTPKIVLDL